MCGLSKPRPRFTGRVTLAVAVFMVTVGSFLVDALTVAVVITGFEPVFTIMVCALVVDRVGATVVVRVTSPVFLVSTLTEDDEDIYKHNGRNGHKTYRKYFLESTFLESTFLESTFQESTFKESTFFCSCTFLGM